MISHGLDVILITFARKIAFGPFSGITYGFTGRGGGGGAKSHFLSNVYKMYEVIPIY